MVKCLSWIVRNNPLKPKICILGIYPKVFVKTAKQTKMTDFGLIHARGMIALC